MTGFDRKPPNYTCTLHITEWNHTSEQQQSLLRWTLSLITRVWSFCLHRQVAGWDAHWRTAFSYRAEAAWRRTGGLSGWADRTQWRSWKGLWERLCQRRGAAGVSAWGRPDWSLSSIGGRGKDWSVGSRDTYFWLADSIARTFFQTLQSLLKQKDVPVWITICGILSLILI